MFLAKIVAGGGKGLMGRLQGLFGIAGLQEVNGAGAHLGPHPRHPLFLGRQGEGLLLPFAHGFRHGIDQREQPGIVSGGGVVVPGRNRLFQGLAHRLGRFRCFLPPHRRTDRDNEDTQHKNKTQKTMMRCVG